MAIITISRGTFSGGKAIAECVARNLGYACISREALRDAARHYGVPLEALSKALSDKPGILENMTQARIHYLAYIQAELIRAVKDENVVYHGLAGHLLLKQVPHVLRVRIIANMEYRIRAAMERTNLSRSDAIDFINQIDQKRDKWVKFLYHVNRNDPSLYDIVINLDRISLPTACGIICTHASLPEYQPTPESRKRLKDMVFAADIRAAVAKANVIDDREIEVDANDGVVTLAGRVRNLVDADKLREVVRTVPNITDINSKLRIRDYT